jgi:hypothetical protein
MPKPPQVATPEPPAANQFAPITLHTVQLDAADTQLIFGAGTKLYGVKLNGSEPVELADMGTVITSVTKQVTDATISVTTNSTTWWQLNPTDNTPQLLSPGGRLAQGIYTLEKPDGTAVISKITPDGTPAQELFRLTRKPLQRQVCEAGDTCTELFYPLIWSASFDGSYLLSLPTKGGGLGEQALVLSSNGTTSYKLPFKWYVTTAIWLDTNKLLTTDPSATPASRILTLKPDGTLASTALPAGVIRGSYKQNYLSPSRRYLITVDAQTIYLVDMETRTSTPIDTGEEIQNVAWNAASTVVMYKKLVYDTAYINVYQVSTGKKFTAASLPRGGKDAAGINNYARANTSFTLR